MNDRSFQVNSTESTAAALAEVWSIAWPTVLTMTSYTVMQFVDKLMVGQVGPVQLAAQGNGGMWSFALMSFALGILTVVNTYVSQNLGAGTPQNGAKYAWAAFWMALALWIVVMIPYGFALPWIFSDLLPSLIPSVKAGHSEALLRMESGYAQILVFGSIALMISRGMNQYFFGMHRPRVVTIAALVGNVVNVIGNYILVYGEAGLPRLGLPGIPGVPALGVYGSAIATVIGTCVELSIPAAVFLGPKMNAQYGTRRAWRPQWRPIRDLFRLGWPAAIQWGNELICWAIFMVILVGSFGEDHMTACTIAFGYMSLSFMPALGFSVAVNSLVGKYMGAGRPETAMQRTRLGLLLAMAYMTLCALIFVVFRHELVGLFVNAGDLAPGRAARIIEIGGKVMILTALFQTVDSIGVVYTGALRGAGDTVWPGVMTFIYSWLFIVGGGAAMIAFWPQLESIGPWLGATVYIVVYGLTMWLRFAGGKWRSIRLLEPAKFEAAQVAPIIPAPPELEAGAAIADIAPAMGEDVAEMSRQRRS